ncbi:MAG: hypothetical protein ABR564_09640, partial [Candidatus Dormibacteria bacterium]
AAGAGAGADFGSALGEALALPGQKDLGRQLNRAAGAAIGTFAETPVGNAAVMEATRSMPQESSPAQRVAAYSHQISDDPARAEAVAGATLGSLMGGGLPDLSRLLTPQSEPEPAT